MHGIGTISEGIKVGTVVCAPGIREGGEERTKGGRIVAYGKPMVQRRRLKKITSVERDGERDRVER